MSTAPKSQSLFLDGPVGKLEAVLEEPADSLASGAAVVLHPHPQHGGTLQNKVTYTLARAFVRIGYSALRFNFRGTGASDGEFDNGEGELDDALAAIAWMRSRNAIVPLWLAGFSFGAAIAVKAATATKVDGLVSVAPAISRFASGLTVQPDCPWLVVQGDNDELVDVAETIDWVNNLEPGPELLVVQGGEHFFHGRLIELREAVTTFAEDSGA